MNLPSSDIAIVIPARMASTRFPGKPLELLGDKPMIQWVYEKCVEAQVSSTVVVATPDRVIEKACMQFGARVIMTSDQHPSGTDRIAEASASLKETFILNVQGDEPLIPEETIRACAEALLSCSELEVASVYDDCPSEDESNLAVVKVVTNAMDEALYFSRARIPFPRNANGAVLKRHLGIYGYGKAALKNFVAWGPSPLELVEGLEQLRFLENGAKIKMKKGKAGPTAVDTPEQLDELHRFLSLG